MKPCRFLLSACLLASGFAALAQTNWPGYIDTNFLATCVSNAGFNNTVRGMIVQADGKIVGVGGFQESTACEGGIFRCDSNGVPDATFQSPFSLLPDLQAVAAVAGGKYVVAGSLFLGFKQHSLARVNANGSLDGTFSLTQTNPAGGSASAFALAVDSLDRLIVGGMAFVTNAVPTIKRLNSNGTVDNTFTPATIKEWAGLGIRAVAVQPDRKILIAGAITNVGGLTRVAIARLNENGSVDDTFDSPFGGISSIAAIRLLTNGQMLVTGGLSTNTGPGLILARLNANGTIDGTFPPVTANAVSVFGGGTAIALQADGKIILTHNSGASRISASGVVDTNYARGRGEIANGGYKSVAIDASGRALVGAEFATLGISRRGLIRLFGGDAPVPAPPSIEAQPTDQNAYAGGSATFSLGVSGSQPLTYNWYFGGLNVGGSATVTFSSLVLGHDNTPIYCIVTNQYGRATSSVVRLYVSPPPVPPTVTTNPISLAVSNPAPITAAMLTEVNLRGKTLHLHILNGAAPFPAAGDYDVVLSGVGNTYSIPAGGVMTASSGGWSFGSELGIDTVLTLSDSYPGGGGPVKIALLADGTYEMYADGVVNNQNGTYRIFNADGTPVGPTVLFTVSADGTAPLNYAWLFNGFPIASPDLPPSKGGPTPDVQGSHSATLTIRNATTINAGGYSAIISNVAGVVTSAVATLTVNGFSGGVTDSSKPTLTLTAPSTRLKTIGSNNVNFAGRAGDNVGLAGVFISVNGGGFFGANGTSNWTANVALAPGTNTIRVWAADLLGNAVTNTRALIYLPVIPLAGTYNGLFFNTNHPAHSNAGGFVVTIKTDGTFKGKVREGTPSYSFSGRFGLDLTATSSVPRTGLSTQWLALRLTGGHLEGNVTDVTNGDSFLVAYRGGSIGTLAGKYTLLLPGSADAASFPGGDGVDALTLTSSGRLSGLGTLGEGSSINLITTVAPGGETPVYYPLYGGTGSLFGWLRFADTPDSDITGTLLWTKPAGLAGAFYSAGFITNVTAAGSRFVSPPRSTPALILTNGLVTLDGGNLANVLSIPVTLGGDNRITGSNGLSLTISTSKGTVSGSFIDPATLAKRTIKGVILRDQNFGGGQFQGTNNSGGLFIGNQP